jgi:phage baseplate assembly protein gpV
MTMTSGAEGLNLKTFGLQPKITIDGAPISDSQIRSLMSMLVETSIGRPNLCELRFVQAMDTQGTPEDDITAAWAPGKKLKVEAGEDLLFVGEITSIDFLGSVASPTEVVLLAFDKRHRMYRHETVRVFKDSSFKDIVVALLGEIGLSNADLSGLPTTVMKYYLHEGSVGDLIERLCDRYALACLWDDTSGEGQVAVMKPSQLTVDAGSIRLAVEMLEYRLRQTTSSDRAKAQVRGWDPKQKQAIVGDANRVDPPGGVVAGPKAQPAFQRADALFHTTYVASQNDAKTEAEALLAGNVDAGMQLDAMTNFLPKAAAGKLIEVEGVPERFAGKYRLTSVRHRYDHTEGGRSDLVCRGADDTTLTGLLEQAVLGGMPATALSVGHGLQPAQVTNVKSNAGEGAVGDQGAAGEVKVKLPWLGDDIESGWLRVVTVGGGKERGFFVMPEIGDEVLVAFHNGDMRTGYVLGGLYNGKDAAPRSAALLTDGTVIQERVWKSRAGHEIVLGDKDGSEYVQIALGDGKTRIRMDKKDTKLTIETTNVTILPNGKIEILSDGEITMKAKTDFKLEAANITLKAQQKVTIEGGTQVSINGTAGAELKGAKVDINSQGPATVKGNPIMLN